MEQRAFWMPLTKGEWKALGLCALLAALFVHDWDGFVFERTVRDLWAGTTPYETGVQAPWYSLLGPADSHPQWYAYPPLPLLLMAATFAAAVFVDLPEPLQRLLLKLPMVAFHLVLARVVAAWARHAGRDADKAHRWTLWNPFLILVGPIWGMTDPMMMAFVLAGALLFVQKRPALAGLAMGGALLVKPFPAFLAIPFVAWAWPRLGGRRLATSAGVAAATFVAVCLPFLASERAGFVQQVGGAHLARAAQGLTIWRWPGLDGLAPHTVQVASMALLAVGLALASLWASRREGPDAPVEALLAGALPVLLLNRVVNEQYVTMVVAPLAILALRGPRWERLHQRLTWVMTAAVVLTGFHFLTFVPPDIALLVFRRPTDEVAHLLRTWMPFFWDTLAKVFLYVVPVALAVVASRLAPFKLGRVRAALPSLALCVVLAAAGAAAPVAKTEAAKPFAPAHSEPQVAAFYYLWWNNPGHDPDVRYGNWLKVSQDPAVGFYTNNRGIAALHSQQMVENGIDTAIVSYHRGEQGRYTVFQEEASRAGLFVAPLIELNQVYDMVVDGQRLHRPVNQDGKEASYAAYRLSDAAQEEVVRFVLDLKPMLAQDNQLRIDGKPVVMFYDAYVSGVSFHAEDQERLARAVLDLFGIEDLRRHYGDATLEPTVEDLLRHHPSSYDEFFAGPAAAPWRAAHLKAHRDFWDAVQARVEAETGPLFWISGDAYNDQAGFEAGIVQSLNNLAVFDGSFIYSPSFTWGTNKGRPFDEVFQVWEDRNHWMEAFGNAQGKWSVVGLAPAYDDTVNRPRIGFVIPDEVDGVSTYDRSWESVLDTRPGWVAIATWNEFFEGSSIEPDTVHGDAWLKATGAYRDRLTQEAPPEAAVALVMSEWQSRLHWQGAERDEPHHWGMALVAAGVRTYANTTPYAFDIQDEGLPAMPTPVAALVDGGHGFHDVSAFVQARLDGWLEDGVPVIVFGPGASDALESQVAPACRALDDVGSPTIRPGDRLFRTATGLWLERPLNETEARTASGTDPATGQPQGAVTVGSGHQVTYRVARPGCDGIKYASVKPYLTGSSVRDAECLAVAVAFFTAADGPVQCQWGTRAPAAP